MDVFEAIRTMLAVRTYQDRPVPADLVHRIIEAARLTPSSRNGQPWHFIAIDDKAVLKKLGELARSGPYIAGAPLAVAVLLEDSIYNVSDGSQAIHAMMLTAWAEGVGSNWVGFHNLDYVKDVLGVPPELSVLAVVPFGYPEKPGGKGKKVRKSLTEMASKNRYGQPFE